MTDLPDGVEVDVAAKTLVILGRPLRVVSAFRSPPLAKGSCVVLDDEMLAVVEQLGLPKPTPRTRDLPEGWHFSVAVGDVGWWVELAMWPAQIVDGVEWPASMYAHEPDGVPDDGGFVGADHSAAQVLALIDEVAQRSCPPSGLDEFTSSDMGCVPGTWMGWDEA